MRIAHLVAGAGDMYCGACMRDHRLVARLTEQGRDVVLLPLYTPIRTDEAEATGQQIYYGGLNVFLAQKSALFRRIPAALRRILDLPILLRGLNRLAAKSEPKDLGALTVSVLAGEHGAQRQELERLIDRLKRLRPTLISLPNLMFVGIARALKTALKTPILCTLPGEDVFLDALVRPYRDQAFELIKRGVNHVDAFIAPTRYYASHASEHFGLDRKRVHYVPMGIRVDDFDGPNDPATGPFTIGYLAGVCPEKGLALLCEAFALLRKRGEDCRLRIAGYVGAAGRTYWAKMNRSLQRQWLEDAVEFLGEVNRAQKLEFLRSLHVLSVPTVYPEAKGFYALEAMACGVPVVQPRHGSFPELIEATGGGRLFEPGNRQALADAIAELKSDEPLRSRLARDGRAAVREKFTDEIMAERTWEVYMRYSGGAGAKTRTPIR